MKIADIIESRQNDMTWAANYGEPGYSLTEGREGIVLADWNDFTKEEIECIETVYDTEWVDEWAVSENMLAYRLHPDCYSWKPSYRVTKDEQLVFPDEEEFWDWLDEPICLTIACPFTLWTATSASKCNCPTVYSDDTTRYLDAMTMANVYDRTRFCASLG